MILIYTAVYLAMYIFAYTSASAIVSRLLQGRVHLVVVHPLKVSYKQLVHITQNIPMLLLQETGESVTTLFIDSRFQGALRMTHRRYPSSCTGCCGIGSDVSDPSYGDWTPRCSCEPRVAISVTDIVIVGAPLFILFAPKWFHHVARQLLDVNISGSSGGSVASKMWFGGWGRDDG